MQSYLRAQIGFLQEQSKLISIQISRLSHLETTLNASLANSSSTAAAGAGNSSTVVSNPDDYSGTAVGSPGQIALSTVAAMELIPLALPNQPSNYQLLKEQLKLEKRTEKERLKAERQIASKSLNKLEKKLTKKEVDPNKPKKPLTAYLLFSNEEMPKLRTEMAHSTVEYTHKDMMVRLGAKWKALTPEERKAYEDMVEPEITSYHQKLEQYQRGKEASAADPEKKKHKRNADEFEQLTDLQDEMDEGLSENKKRKKDKHT